MDDLENTIEKKINEVNQIFAKSFNDNYRLTKLSDSKIGYSIKRDYDEDVVKKLGIIDKKTYTSLTHLSIDDRDLEESNKKKLPVNIEINCLLFEDVENKFVYNYEYITNQKMKPINISTQGYTLDLLNKQFYKDNEKIELIDIYSEVYKKHIKPTLPLKGLPFRVKVYYRRLLLFALNNFSLLIIKLLHGIFDYNIKVKITTIRNSDKKDSSYDDKSESKQKTFEFLGYKESSRTIISYSLFHFVLYLALYYFHFKPVIIKNIINYQFLTLIYVITSMAIFGKLIPEILIFVVKVIENKIEDYEFKPIKV